MRSRKHYESPLHVTGPFAFGWNPVCYKEGDATVALTNADSEESRGPTGRPATLLALFWLPLSRRRARNNGPSRIVTL